MYIRLDASALRTRVCTGVCIGCKYAKQIEPANVAVSEKVGFGFSIEGRVRGRLNAALGSSGLGFGTDRGVSEAYHIPLDCGGRCLEGGVLRRALDRLWSA